MTTRITIRNEDNSNGDVVLEALRTSGSDGKYTLLPGDQKELWITDSSLLIVTETWPTKKDRNGPVGKLGPALGPGPESPAPGDA